MGPDAAPPLAYILSLPLLTSLPATILVNDLVDAEPSSKNCYV